MPIVSAVNVTLSSKIMYFPPNERHARRKYVTLMYVNIKLGEGENTKLGEWEDKLT